MIPNIPDQRVSPNAHIRGWGCLFSCYGALVQHYLKKLLSPIDVAKVFNICIRDKSVWDNITPTTLPGWYRAYCVEPEKIIKSFGEYMHADVKGEMLSRTEHISSTPGDCYTIVEMATANGSHFVIQSIAEGGFTSTLYDPWPRLKRTGVIRSYRHWRIS